MSTTHYENANFLSELAENLPRILPTGSADKAELLQCLADDELTQAEYDDRVRAKVAAARADTRPRLTTEQVRQRLQTRYPEATAASRSPVASIRTSATECFLISAMMESKPSASLATENCAIALLAVISSVAFEISIPTQSGPGRLIITHPCKCVFRRSFCAGFRFVFYRGEDGVSLSRLC